MGRLPRIALQPLAHVVIEELLAPDHPGQRCAGRAAVLRHAVLQTLVEPVGFLPPLLHDGVEARERLRVRLSGESKLHGHVPARGHVEAIMRRDFRPALLRIHRAGVPVHHEVMERILEETLRVLHAVHPPRIGIVLGEQPRRAAIAVQPVCADGGAAGDDAVAVEGEIRLQAGIAPCPGVPKPQLRQQMDLRRLEAAVCTVTRISVSYAVRFTHSTNTSKYLSSSNAPASISSNSG